MEKGKYEVENWYSWLVSEGYLHDFMENSKDLKLIKRDLGIDYRDKFRGAMLGVAIGDALGAPFEGWSHYDIARQVGKITDYVVFHEGMLKGAVSDDTMLTISLAEAYIEAKGFDPEVIAKKFRSRWYPHIGNSLRGAISNLKMGKPWYDAGLESASNGGAKRSAPVGLVNYHSYRRLKMEAAVQTFITHKDQMAIAASVAVSFAVAYAINLAPGELSNEETIKKFISGVVDAIEGIEIKEYRTHSTHKRTTLHRRLAEELYPVLVEYGNSPHKVYDLWYNSSYALESVPCALYTFLRTPESFEEVVITAVNAGHDTDSTAAMAGAIAGAYLGMSAIPERLVKEVEYRDTLISLADQLYDLAILR
jgi:ADP-ribosylglycohydrolase